MSSRLKQRWDAKALEILLHRCVWFLLSFSHRQTRYPRLHAAFIDVSKTNDHDTQWAVLIRGGKQEDEGTVEEVYRIRMPYNKNSDRGVIIGERKAENQNYALCFAFGETLQMADVNQDNYLMEAIKMRSLLEELRSSGIHPKRSPPKNCKEYAVSSRKKLDRSYARNPVLIGLKEQISTEETSIPGSFMLRADSWFSGSVRHMASLSNTPVPCGSSNVWDKIYVQTRGGVSKATTDLHSMEDIFGGTNAALRGGRIVFRYSAVEYYTN